MRLSIIQQSAQFIYLRLSFTPGEVRELCRGLNGAKPKLSFAGDLHHGMTVWFDGQGFALKDVHVAANQEYGTKEGFINVDRVGGKRESVPYREVRYDTVEVQGRVRYRFRPQPDLSDQFNPPRIIRQGSGPVRQAPINWEPAPLVEGPQGGTPIYTSATKVLWTNKGKVAFRQGTGENGCPARPGSLERKYWLEGWDEEQKVQRKAAQDAAGAAALARVREQPAVKVAPAKPPEIKEYAGSVPPKSEIKVASADGKSEVKTAITMLNELMEKHGETITLALDGNRIKARVKVIEERDL